MEQNDLINFRILNLILECQYSSELFGLLKVSHYEVSIESLTIRNIKRLKQENMNSLQYYPGC